MFLCHCNYAFVEMKSLFLLLFLLSASLLISACGNLGYYAQSISGQMEILRKREAIAELLQNPQLDNKLRQKLQLVQEIRNYASDTLSLPDNGSYRSYVDLQRPYVVWNVFAAPEFSIELKEWCFPFAGCVRYRGYFSPKEAEEYAQILKQKGDDVYVSGVAAYSTLGWFDDPVLNTILQRDDARLAGLIFHELAHQQLYVKGDTAFNEGFASTVETEGVRRWLADKNDNVLAEEYATHKRRHEQFVSLVKTTRDKLDKLYSSTQGDEAKREQKQALIAQMQSEYQHLKQEWGGYSGYDAWFGKDINNAKLAAVSTYQDYVPAFRQLLLQNHGDFSAFYAEAARLADLEQEARQQAMQSLSQSH